MVEKHTLLQVINRAVIIVSIVAFTAGAYPDEYDSLVARAVVDSLDISQFKSYIKGLADLGGREYGTQSNTQGREHLISTLEDLDMKMLKHSLQTIEMYIVQNSAQFHLIVSI